MNRKDLAALTIRLEQVERQTWEAAAAVHSDVERYRNVASRLEAAANLLGQLETKVQAQLVINGLEPDVEQLVALMDSAQYRLREEHVSLQKIVRRIAERMGLE